MSFNFPGNAFQDIPYNNSDPMLGPPPREIRLTPVANVIRTVVLLLVLGLAVGGPITALRDHMRQIGLRDRGVKVLGTITNKYQTHSKSGTDSYVEYRYRTGNTDYTDKTYVSEARYDSLAQGLPVAIFVLPEDPSVHHFGPATNETVDMDFRMAIDLRLLCLVIIGLLSYGTSRRMHLESHLLQNGIAVQAHINGVSRRRLDIFTALWGFFQGLFPLSSALSNSEQICTVTCHFKSGQFHRITTFDLRENVASVLSAGSETTLLYNPARPEQCLLYYSINYATLCKGRF